MSKITPDGRVCGYRTFGPSRTRTVAQERNPMQHLKKWLQRDWCMLRLKDWKVQQPPHSYPYFEFTNSPLVVLKVNYVSCFPDIHIYIYGSLLNVYNTDWSRTRAETLDSWRLSKLSSRSTKQIPGWHRLLIDWRPCKLLVMMIYDLQYFTLYSPGSLGNGTRLHQSYGVRNWPSFISI